MTKEVSQISRPKIDIIRDYQVPLWAKIGAVVGGAILVPLGIGGGIYYAEKALITKEFNEQFIDTNPDGKPGCLAGTPYDPSNVYSPAITTFGIKARTQNDVWSYAVEPASPNTFTPDKLEFIAEGPLPMYPLIPTEETAGNLALLGCTVDTTSLEP